MALPRDRRDRWPSGPNKLLEQGYPLRSHFSRKSCTPASKPRRPVTGYDVFLRNAYPDMKAKYPSFTQQQIYSMIGRMWRETLTWQDRQICYDFADEEKDVYYAQMKEWRKKRNVVLQEEKAAIEAKKAKIAERKEAELKEESIKWVEEPDCKVQ
uniref:HMG box domain-containing protein n=1 Tax=Romanomermis culicivorax TaxID=13658 RepID=A0A915JXE4_ROMCU